MRIVKTNLAARKGSLDAAIQNQRDRLIKKAAKDIPGLITPAIMKKEAKRLAKYIEKQIRNYYASYSPKMYKRSEQLQGEGNVAVASARVDISPDGQTLTAYVDIKEIPSSSRFEGGMSVDRVKVIDKGWAVKKDVWFRDIEHFGHQEGFGFIKKGIADFNKKNTYDIQVSGPD